MSVMLLSTFRKSFGLNKSKGLVQYLKLTKFSIKAANSGKPVIGSLSPIKASNFVGTLSAEERQILLSALQKHNHVSIEDEPVGPVSMNQLLHVSAIYSLPFIGFGFLDNFIMIIAGDYIDLKLGTMLGISTMAAAGLGNTISDVAGIGSAWYVESMTSKLGVPQPNLDPRQLALSSCRWAINIGRCFGVTIGCLLGMLPLLFLTVAEDKDVNKDVPSC